MKNFKDSSMEELAQIIAEHLKSQSIEVVVVGGLAVSLYTDNRYLTKDIDMVDISYQKPQKLRAAMSQLGFEKVGRVYSNATTEIVVEFPSGPLSVGDELITDFACFESPSGDIPVLLAVDIVKDRLSAYVHWKDQQSLVQALAVMLNHAVNPNGLKNFFQREGAVEQFDELRSLYSKLSGKRLLEMVQIEEFIVGERLEKL